MTTRPPTAATGSQSDVGPEEPLTGLSVVEVSAYVAAPSGGMTLAQLGADVVRVDPIGGSPDHRRWPLGPDGRTSLYWTGLNKGKRSVALDLRDPPGQQLLTELICRPGPDGGVFLTNTVGRPWLGYDQLRAHRRDVIHLHVQGHADGRPAVGYTVNAAVGLPWLTGPAEAVTR